MQSIRLVHASILRKSSSRIYQDLASCRTAVRKYSDDTVQRLIMDVNKKTRPQGPSKSPASICIVGAGVAGLRCADVLLRHGFGVTILEGRDRNRGACDTNKTLFRPCSRSWSKLDSWNRVKPDYGSCKDNEHFNT